MERQWSVNDFNLASWILQGQWNAANPQSTYWQPLSAKMLLTMLRPPPTIERPQYVNNLCRGSASYTAMKCITLFLNGILRGQSLQSVLVYNCTNILAMTHRSDFFAYDSRVNI